MAHSVTLIAGDSVGPEVAAATQRLIARAGVDIDWIEAAAGQRAYDSMGNALPDETLDAIRHSRVALKGRLRAPVGGSYESPTVGLRKALSLYAALRPIKSCPGITSRYDDVDVVIIRESTEDVYAGIEHEVIPGVVQSLKITTEKACERIARFAYEYARKHDRKKITIVHKANIMKRSDGLFVACAERVGADYDDIETNRIIADNACMQMVRWPWQFDVLLTQNLFGDLLSDIGAGLTGGISSVWGLMRDDSDIHVYECIHGLAPGLEGQGVANPLPFIRPALHMLRHLGETSAADRIDSAITELLGNGVGTRDVGGEESTESFVDAVLRHMGA